MGLQIPSRDIVEAAAGLTERVSGYPCDLAGTAARMKGGPLGPSAAHRHRWRAVILRAPLPAIAEFRSLRWLERRLFRVPRPLAAVALYGKGALSVTRLPLAQALWTQEIAGAVPLDQAWSTASGRQREAWCEELGLEVGRMHALRFLHADLFPRNVLASAPSANPQDDRPLYFIDTWAGGPTAWRAGSLRRLEDDLGAWLAEAEPWLDEPFLGIFLGAYLSGRAKNGRPVPRVQRWLMAVQEARRRQLRRFERQRYRLRGQPFPKAGFAAPVQLQ